MNQKNIQRSITLVLFLLSTACSRADSNSPALPPNPLKNQPLTANNSVSPPLPTPPRSPVELFRNVLAMSSIELREFLANRPAQNRERLLAKIREYQMLKPDERELRLRVTELRWYLLPLMSTTATNRAAELESLPAEMRPLVEERLNEWDLLPPPMQKDFLENESAIRFFTETEAGGATQKTNVLSSLPPSQRESLESSLGKWQAMPESQRQGMLKQFDRFFGLNQKEKERALKTLSHAERQQIEKTLKNFAALPPAHRSQAIRSFEKFASLSPSERQLFLKNAEKWEQMTPAERQSWRNLVNTLTLLPIPPSRLAPRPPLPPAFKPPLPTALATNR